MESNNYITIQGWMCNELGLKGNELLIYALIYGFSQDSKSMFSGGRQYIADTFNISLPTVDKALQNLINKDYIVKHSSKDYINTDRYQANMGVVKKLYEGSKETLLGGSKETLLNNTIYNNINNISKDILLQPNVYDNVSDKLYDDNPKKKKRKNLFEKCLDAIDEYTDDLELQDLLVTYLKMRLEVKEKPLYYNMWRGLLSKLFSLSNNLADLCNIVQQSIDKGWLSFYEIKAFSGKKKDLQVVSSEFGVVTCNKSGDEEMTDAYF